MTVALCPFCRRELSDDMSVLVNLDGSLSVVCWICWDRGEEAATFDPAEGSPDPVADPEEWIDAS